MALGLMVRHRVMPRRLLKWCTRLGVVVERAPPPPPVVVQRTPPPPRVVVERPQPVIVYEEPFVVERRSSVYYYYSPSYRYHSYHMETEREYHGYRSDNWEDGNEY